MEEQFLHSIAEHQGIIHKVCRIYRDTPEDRDDLFQEIVYQLWKAFPAFRGQSAVSTWMYRIALSVAIAKYRKKDRAASTVSLETARAVPLPTAEEHPKQELLYQAIARLSDAEKAIITLYLDSHSYQEIAEIIGITTNHVGVKLNRIKQKLIHQLNPQNYETG